MIGLIAKKEGMTQYFSEDGSLIPVTLLSYEDNIVVNKKTVEKDGYNAIVVGVIDLKEKKLTKPYKGQFPEGIAPKKILKEYRIDNVDEFKIGQKVGFEILDDVVYLDVVGTSKGKGYQGVMKRHGFSGGRKTHGSKFHRQNGSTGQAAWPSRGFKGVKRAGRMGTDKVTVFNLKLIKKDENKNLLIVKGCVPGNDKGIVFIRKAIKK
jgi:large subunit ribosomal protein L3